MNNHDTALYLIAYSGGLYSFLNSPEGNELPQFKKEAITNELIRVEKSLIDFKVLGSFPINKKVLSLKISNANG